MAIMLTEKRLTVFGLLAATLFAGVALGRRAPHEAGRSRVVEPSSAQLPAVEGADASSAPSRAGDRLRESVARAHPAETRDPQWSKEAHNRLSARLAAIAGKDRISTIDCRSTLCRVELDFPNLDALSAFHKQLGDPNKRPWDGEMFMPNDGLDRAAPDAAQHAVLYVAREGATLRGREEGAAPEAAR